MPLLNDFLYFSDHPLMLLSAQMFAEHLPAGASAGESGRVVQPTTIKSGGG